MRSYVLFNWFTFPFPGYLSSLCCCNQSVLKLLSDVTYILETFRRKDTYVHRFPWNSFHWNSPLQFFRYQCLPLHIIMFNHSLQHACIPCSTYLPQLDQHRSLSVSQHNTLNFCYNNVLEWPANQQKLDNKTFIQCYISKVLLELDPK